MPRPETSGEPFDIDADWWARYLEETQAATSDSDQADGTDDVEPEFTAWTWGYEDDPDGELQPPGSSSTSISTSSDSGSDSGSSAGSGSSTEASPDSEPKLTWWQRYLLKKRGK